MALQMTFRYLHQAFLSRQKESSACDYFTTSIYNMDIFLGVVKT